MRTAMMIAAAFVAPAVAAAQDKAPSPNGNDIVVTGQRLSDTKRALDECIARHCPPDQDIRATLLHAENAFVAGDYHEARSTLLASIGRNKHEGKDYPVQLGDLYRANARVAVNMGEARDFQASEIASLDALRAGLPSNDARILAQRIEVADVFAKIGRSDAALYAYRDIAADALKAGDRTMEGYALLRHAVLFATLADADHATYATDAKKAIDALAAETDPALLPFANAAALLRARRAAKAGDPGAIDALVKQFARTTKHPTLLYEPVVLTQDSGRAYAGGTTTARMAVGSFENQWVDVSFWVTPDGRVTDVDMLRQSPTLDPSWVKPITDAIGKRRYAPLQMDKSAPGVIRIERYTRTADWGSETGTHLRARQPVQRIEMVDLTAEPAGEIAPRTPAVQPTAPVPVG